ncbi:MAG TPA: PD-(D/E)XK nuclease family protein [Candidatus Polarisedimenticolia bacterium]|nr:PD-(D/E)XK nuclease family protein [Candidatus Polarisedimenticolia bacterium]
MTDLLFDEAAHAYTRQGIPLPSVTQVLKAEGVIDDSFYPPGAAARGTAVHRLCARLDEGALWPEDVNAETDEVLAYFAGYEAFRRETDFAPLLVEHRLAYGMDYAGTLDRVGTLNGRTVLFDIKTGGLPRWGGLQTAAYLLALATEKHSFELPRDRFIIQLTREGRYKLWPVNGARDAETFLALVRVYQWKRDR